jgi:hypothetical protein
MINYIVNSGFAVGSPVDLRQYPLIRAIGVPGITSGDMFIQGAMGQANGSPPNSGDFARLLETRAVGSGYAQFATGPGSLWIAWPFGDSLPQWMRPEFAVAQADTRTLTLLTSFPR